MAAQEETAEDVPLQYVLAGVAVALLVIGIIVYFLLPRKKERKGTFALTGISNAGKTALFYLLKSGKNVHSHTSMQVNEGVFPLHSERSSERADRATKKSIRLVDIPGHEKLRFLLSNYDKELGGIVFLIDSASFHTEFRAVAEYLYDVLSNSALIKNKVPVLIGCNKTDLSTARSLDQIRAALQDEFNKLRTTRSAAPERQSDDTNSGERHTAFLGYENKAFSFDDLENEVEFADCSVAQGHIEQIESWIRQVYPL